MKIALTLAFTFFTCGLCFAQVDSNAVKNADSLLAAVKIAEIPEGVQAARAASWKIGKLPVLLDYTKLYEGMFDTDIPSVKGYKQLLEVKIQSEGSTSLTTKYILISYKDLKSGMWKVFDFRELKGTSIEQELEAAKRDLGDTTFMKDQFNYRRYAYWLMLAGELQEAKLASEKAIALNKIQPDPNFDSECSENIQIINAILGKSI